ncbi:MAG: HAD family hydrolase [bacterium]|nr:HAD family hydrolase [bacterium]
MTNSNNNSYNNAQYKAIIFDRDGVLLDYNLSAASDFLSEIFPFSLKELAGHVFKWFGEQPAPRTREEEKKFWHTLWTNLSNEYNLETEKKERLYTFNYIDLVYPYDDARPALTKIKEEGILTGVLTNAPLPSINETLEAAGLAGLIDIAHVAPLVSKAKPAPAAYETIADELMVKPEECLFIDNLLQNVEGANACGMRGFRIDRSLSSSNSEERTLYSLDDIPKLLF